MQGRCGRLERYFALDRQNTVLLAELAACHEAAGDFDKALAAYRSLCELEIDSALRLNDVGRIELALGRYADAAKTFEKAVFLEPQAAVLWYHLGRALLDDGQRSAALDAMKRASDLDSDNSRIQFFLGIALDECGDADAAKRAFEASLRADPANHDAALFLAYAGLEEGAIDRATDLADQVLASSPVHIPALLLRAQLRLVTFEPELALELSRRIREVEPRNPDALLCEAQANLLMQRVGRAEELLQELLAIDHDASGVARLSLGWALLNRGDWKKAEQYFSELRRLQPSHPDPMAGIAVTRLLAGDRSGALRAAEDALAIDSEQPVARFVQHLAAAERRPDEVEAGVARLMGEVRLTPFGWTPKDVIERFSGSKAGHKVLDKYARLGRRRKGRPQ